MRFSARVRIVSHAFHFSFYFPFSIFSVPPYAGCVLALDSGADFDPARDAEFFSGLPERPAVFRVDLHDAAARPYLARTANLRARLRRLLGPPDPASKRLNLRELAAGIRYRVAGSPFEQSVMFYQQARAFYPRRYRAVARLRPPALLKLNLRNAYPRCYVTRRILDDTGFYFGPFPSRRAADTFAGEFLNLFKIRRCQIKIRRDPAFPGCIYSEMKMCLAPCFAGCTDEEYAGETSRVVSFLESRGAALMGELESEREAASSGEDFERASGIHKKMEKVAGVLRDLPGLPRHIAGLDAVVLQPVAARSSVACFTVRAGRLADPFLLEFGQLASQPRSLEELLRGHLDPQSAPPADADAGTRTLLEDHLSLLARWYYSKPRTGEIFFREPDWPYRKIIRACSRVLASAQPREEQAK